jgi:hypothetical protein
MIKLIPLARTARERAADDDALGEPVGEPDGIDVHLDHHHLAQLGAQDYPRGRRVAIDARGHVAGTSDDDGRRHARIRVTHMALQDLGPTEESERTEAAPRDDLRSEIEKIHGEAEAKRSGREQERAARTGRKMVEKRSGE